MAEIGIIASIIGVAGAGFRLSLLLNGVASEMAHADTEIHNIAKGISLFSLMLKQVGKTMEEGRTLASASAIETATEIRDQSELVFKEIERMINLSQGRDEKGHIRSITIAERVKWCFKKQKVQYLLGQLESLKLSLSIMLQILQMGKMMAATHDDPTRHQISERGMLQERLEIQNMIVVQHWSLVELRKLYELAESEAQEEAVSPTLEDPPPLYTEHRSSSSSNNGLQLSIEAPPPLPPKLDQPSQAMVKFQEEDLHKLDMSFNKALTRENQVLNANVYDIVDHLIGEWMRTPRSTRSTPRSSPKASKHKAYYSSDDESDTNSEFSGHDIKGRYLEAPRRKNKGVHFQPSVESDDENSDHSHSHSRSHRRTPKRHILHSESDTSTASDEDSEPTHNRSQPNSRRNSTETTSSSSRYAHERQRTPYANSSNLPNVPENRPPSSRGIPQPPMPLPSRPQPQHYPTAPSNPNSLRGGPGPSYAPNGALGPRPPGAGPYMAPPPPQQGYIPNAGMSPLPSPQPPSGLYFPQNAQRPPGSPMGPPPPMQTGMGGMAMQTQRPPRGHGAHGRHGDRLHDREKKERDNKAASRNLKRGLFAGAGLAGILDLLQGLDGL